MNNIEDENLIAAVYRAVHVYNHTNPDYYNKTEYYKKHPDGVNPVRLSDVVFARPAVALTLVPVIQSLIYEEWDLVFGDPTKFGLGLFSVLFDTLFMVQHYILYNPKRIRELSHEPLLDSNGNRDAE